MIQKRRRQQLMRIQRAAVAVVMKTALLLLVLPAASRHVAFLAAFTAVPAYISSSSSSSWKNSNMRTTMSSYPLTVLFASKKNPPISLFRNNEFSRTIPPDRIKTRGGGRDGGFRMPLLQANATECQALAKRFAGGGDSGSGSSYGLMNVSKLEASVTLRPESLGGTTVGSSDFGIEAQGTIMASITQTCVRTNEKFNVDLEFPIYAIVRPAVVAATRYYRDDGADDDLDDAAAAAIIDKSNNNNNNRKRKKSSSVRGKSQNINEMDLLQLQRMMQQDMEADDDALLQDESIYAAGGGVLDVGELVTQLFFLQIDPYPKKPGTSPVQRSISTTTSSATTSTSSSNTT